MTDQLLTITQVAKLHGVTERRADYAARSYGVEPTMKAGIIRLFDAAAVERIGSAIKRIETRRELAHA